MNTVLDLYMDIFNDVVVYSVAKVTKEGFVRFVGTGTAKIVAYDKTRNKKKASNKFIVKRRNAR